MTNKNITLVKNNLKYFENISEKLANAHSTNGEWLINLFGDITNHIATLTDNIDFADEYDPADAISGDNGDIEDGENMLFYYQQLVRYGDYDTSNTDTIYSYFVGGSKIKHDDYLYVNHIADNDDPADVEEVTPDDLKDGVVGDVIFDLKGTLAQQKSGAKN